MIAATLAKYLETRRSIRNLIGAGAIFRERVPSEFNEQLCIVISNRTKKPYNDILGEPQIAETSLQVDAFATDIRFATKADKLAEEIRQHLSGYRGYWGETYIHGCTLENDLDLAVPPPEGSNIQRYQVVSEFKINHWQPAITVRNTN